MRRRELIRLLGGAALAWPGMAISQPSQQLRRVGVLLGTSEGDVQAHPYLLTFQKALNDLGWTEGRNIRIDYRFVLSDPARIKGPSAGLQQSVG
jgi:putative tryptophan/tyrosine transport system substrate-binding protein